MLRDRGRGGAIDATLGLAPIVVFAHRRPAHLRKVLESLRSNELAAQSALVVFVDGPRSPSDVDMVEEVVRACDDPSGFASVTVNRSRFNRGLASSITTGVTQILQSHGRAIVVEDDIVVSRHFLEYMNTALELYRDDPRVASVHGYVYPVGEALPETFFLRGADCWGWATWARAWESYNADAAELAKMLHDANLVRLFDFGGHGGYMKMLQDQVRGANDSWAVRWYASAFLNNMYTLYPGNSLVRNIGLDGSGRHCSVSANFDTPLADGPVRVTKQEVVDSPLGRRAFTAYFRATARRPTPVARAQSLLNRRTRGQ